MAQIYPGGAPSATANPSPFKTKPGPAHVPPSTNAQLRAAACVWADWAVQHRSQFTYTEGVARSHMFNSRPGSVPQSADCSQFCASILNWAGVTHGTMPGDPLNDRDYTGTLLRKGKHLTVDQVREADVIIYGPGTGSHAVFVRGRISATDFWVVSHGTQGDPSRLRHSDLVRYFQQAGHAGVTYLAFLL